MGACSPFWRTNSCKNSFKRSRTKSKPSGWTAEEAFEREQLTTTECNVPLDSENRGYQEVQVSVDCSISSTLFSEVFVLIVEIGPYFEMMLHVLAYRISNEHCFSAEKKIRAAKFNSSSESQLLAKHSMFLLRSQYTGT